MNTVKKRRGPILNGPECGNNKGRLKKYKPRSKSGALRRGAGFNGEMKGPSKNRDAEVL